MVVNRRLIKNNAKWTEEQKTAQDATKQTRPNARPALLWIWTW